MKGIKTILGMKHLFAIFAQNIARIMSKVVSLHHIAINTKNRQMTITSEHCEDMYRFGHDAYPMLAQT